PHVVAVEEGDVRALGLIQPRVASAVGALIRLVNVAHALRNSLRYLRDDGAGFVGAAVIDNHKLPVGERLSAHRLDGLCQEPRTVVRWQDDAYGWSAHSGLLDGPARRSVRVL